MIVYLVRHGLSVANEKRLVTGTPNDPLSSRGVDQATFFAHWIADFNIKADCYFVSHWKRAQQTADIAFPDVNWQIDSNIGETYAGDVSDMELANFLEMHPDFYLNNENNYPNGESHFDLNNRVMKWLKSLLSKPYKSVVVVAHSGPIACILQQILKIPMVQFPALLPHNATITPIEVYLTEDGEVRGTMNGFSLGPKENLSPIILGR